jgi:2-dehydropantoate 2-reductase
VAVGSANAIVVDPAVQEAFMRMMQECFAVAAAHGYAVADQLDLGVWTKHRGQHKPSMQQDYEAGRPMEIAQMVLAPVAFARAAGLATPTLDAVTAIAARRAIDKGLYTPA